MKLADVKSALMNLQELLQLQEPTVAQAKAAKRFIDQLSQSGKWVLVEKDAKYRPILDVIEVRLNPQSAERVRKEQKAKRRVNQRVAKKK